MKRICSLLLVLTMVLSMVTFVYAEETVEINYWNADSTKISIDLSKEIATEDLEAAITLTADGEPLVFTVEKREKTVNTTIDDYVDGKYDVKGLDVTTDTTYEIKPEGGLGFESVYTITVGSAVTGTSDWSKTFKVKKLWIEDFNKYEIAGGASKGTSTSAPWKLESGATPEFGLEDDGNGDKALYWSHKGATYRVRPAYAAEDTNSDVEFADTGLAASAYWADGSDARKETEYNIELDMRFGTTFSDANRGFGFKIAMQNLKHNQVLYAGSGIAAGYVGTTTGFGMVAGTWGHGVYKYNAEASFSTNYKNGLKSNWYEYFKNGVSHSTEPIWDNSYMKKSKLDDLDWTNDTVHKVSMSVKDENIKFGLDDAFMSYNFDAHAGKTSKQFGLFAFYGDGNYGGTNIYYVDNIVVTKVIEIETYELTAPADTRIDREGIKFELDANLDVESLKGGISVEKDGQAVTEFDVTKVADEDVYTYTVSLAEDVDVDGLYTFSLAEGTYFDVDGNYAILSLPYTQEVAITLSAMEAPLAWNADSTKITLDFKTRLDADSLYDYLTITSSGKEVSYTIVEKTQTSPSKGTLKDSDAYTYAIYPEGGMLFNTLYKLNIASGLIDLNYTCRLEEDYNLAFAVEKIWKDDFEGYATDNFKMYSIYNLKGAGYVPEVDDYATVSKYVTLKNAQGDKSLRVTGGIPVIMNFSHTGTESTFADTGKYMSEIATDLGQLEDYTVELKVSFENDATSASEVTDLRFLMRDCAHTNVQYGMGIGTGIGNNKGKYFDAAYLNHITKKAGTSTKEASTSSTGDYVSANYRNTISTNPFKAVGDNTVTMSVKDKNLKFFFNDGVFNSYNYVSDVAAYGYLSFAALGNTIALIDDIVVTKASVYEESGFSMTPSAGDNDVAIGDTINLTFEKELDSATVSKDTIKILKDGETFDGYTLTLDETDASKVVVKFDEPFDYRTEYTVSPFGVYYVGDTTKYAFEAASFVTTIPDVEISVFEIDDGFADLSNLTADSYKVSATVVNNKLAKVKAVVSVCLYNENNKLVKVAVKSIDIKKGESATVMDTWKITNDEEGKYTARCYVWDSYSSMNTLLPVEVIE